MHFKQGEFNPRLKKNFIPYKSALPYSINRIMIENYFGFHKKFIALLRFYFSFYFCIYVPRNRHIARPFTFSLFFLSLPVSFHDLIAAAASMFAINVMFKHEATFSLFSSFLPSTTKMCSMSMRNISQATTCSVV